MAARGSPGSSAPLAGPAASASLPGPRPRGKSRRPPASRPRPRRSAPRARRRSPSPGPAAPLPPLPRCCVPACRRSPASAPPHTLFHPLPPALGPRQRWFQAIIGRSPRGERRRCSIQLQRIRKPYICSDHFKPGEVVTPETLPSVFTRSAHGSGSRDGTPGSPQSSCSSSSSPPRPSCSFGGETLARTSCHVDDDVDAPPRPGEVSRGRIGDLVLAAELMEMVSETVQHVQKEERFEQAFGHDHGAYVVPDDVPTLKKMVKEMKDTIYAQNSRLVSLQRELASTLAQYKDIKVITAPPHTARPRW
ncbi:uncharacterized protein LOC144490365 [Mustelus asterias]